MSHGGRLWGLSSSSSSWYHSPGALCTRFRCFLIRLSAHTAWESLGICAQATSPDLYVLIVPRVPLPFCSILICVQS